MYIELAACYPWLPADERNESTLFYLPPRHHFSGIRTSWSFGVKQRRRETALVAWKSRHAQPNVVSDSTTIAHNLMETVTIFVTFGNIDDRILFPLYFSFELVLSTCAKFDVFCVLIYMYVYTRKKNVLGEIKVYYVESKLFNASATYKIYRVGENLGTAKYFYTHTYPPSCSIPMFG